MIKMLNAQRSFIALTMLAVLFLASLWHLFEIWLIMFASILMAVMLLSGVSVLAKFNIAKKLPHGVQVGVVIALCGILFAIFALLFGQELWGQLDGIKKQLPNAVQNSKNIIVQVPYIGSWLANNSALHQLEQKPMELLNSLAQSGFGGVPAAFSTLLNAILITTVIMLVGIFLAINPRVYTKSILALVPISQRPKAVYLLERSYHALQQWLFGQFLVMAFVGICTTISLWLMKVPFALALGLIAFLLDFVPVVGPWLSAVPIVLIVLLLRPDMIWWALAMIVIVQQLESYVVAPLVQQKLVDLPPVALLLSQFAMGGIGGVLGVALATPLVVALIVWVQVLYVKFTLGDYAVRVLGQSDDDALNDKYTDTRYKAQSIPKPIKQGDAYDAT